MHDPDDTQKARRPVANRVAKFYFLVVWAVCFVTFSWAMFDPAVEAFIQAKFWWFFFGVVSAMCAAPLLFPRGLSGLMQSVREQEKRAERR